MRIKINGIIREFVATELTISEILREMGYTFPIVIVKYQDKVILNNEFSNVLLSDGEEISIIHEFAGG